MHGLDLTRALVLEVKVLVLELLPVDGHPARAVRVGEVAALEHEPVDHAVEDRVLVVQRLPRVRVVA